MREYTIIITKPTTKKKRVISVGAKAARKRVLYLYNQSVTNAHTTVTAQVMSSGLNLRNPKCLLIDTKPLIQPNEINNRPIPVTILLLLAVIIVVMPTKVGSSQSNLTNLFIWEI